MDTLDVNLINLIFTLVVAIISCVWTLSGTKHNFQIQINSVRNELRLELSEIRHELELLKQSESNHQEKSEYLINDLYSQIKHKASRLEGWINDINKYLENNMEFKARRGHEVSEE
ncbi:MAG: hypothetical protein AB4372_40685 [Xenococcus sp. (in: cyanobacteria)]